MSLPWDPAVGLFWGKSQAGPPDDLRVMLLLQHLLDSAAVGELLWDQWLAEGVRSRLNACSAGRGRELLALLCGLHDVGKASPAFQGKAPQLGERVRAAGLGWTPLDRRARGWHHTLAGAVIVRRVLAAAGWDKSAVGWVWPLIAGHHGVLPGLAKLKGDGPGDAQGRTAAWWAAQDALVAAVAGALQVDLVALQPCARPRRAEQLALSGAIIMADWIASGVDFEGVAEIENVSMAGARRRAELAWKRLGLRGGWTAGEYVPAPDLMTARFGRAAREVQRDAIRLAEQMPVAGLMMIEAPMGEGKTEAALVAAEVLSRRFGANGVFVGMPTQATSDPMFTRVREWVRSFPEVVPVGLLHGKRRFNREWRELLRSRFDGIHDDDVDAQASADSCGADPGAGRSAADAPADWFLGNKRGLLMPVTVGTIDHLLYAATRTRHVMLRHTGLAGRVVILDEVHAYDVYMQQFLGEALRWLADAGVPVILLSATLPPPLRRRLAVAYLQGARQCREVEVPAGFDDGDGYPVIRTVWSQNRQADHAVARGVPWRASQRVRVEVLPEGRGDGPDAVVALLREALVDGGCALVVRNTVGRAQRTYRAVKEEFGSDVILLHARLIIGERTDRAGRVLRLLGPPGRGGASVRPRRLVVVATQLAEQSFDIDVDVLITDLAPIDLLLQRAGRLHRHDRDEGVRPKRVAAPRMIVTGMRPRAGEPPVMVGGSVQVYGEYPLLRAADLVIEAATDAGWKIPADVPALVQRGYDDDAALPDGWRDTAAVSRTAWQDEQASRGDTATKFLLAGEDALGSRDLGGLHELHAAGVGDDDAAAAVVRDGPESLEVILVRRGERGYRTLDGRSIVTSRAALSDPDIVEAVVNTALRLPGHHRELIAAAKDELRPLPGCGADPWLRKIPALVLDGNNATTLGGRRLVYDLELGLLDEPAS